MSDKTQNQKAWLFVLPVSCWSLHSISPLMAVLNYASRESDNIFFFEG